MHIPHALLYSYPDIKFCISSHWLSAVSAEFCQKYPYATMAQSLAMEVEEQLNCSICLDTYTDPKQLQCNHVYCQECLVKLVVRDQQGQLGLPCPTCRQVTPIPCGGVAGLQSAFHINYILDLRRRIREHISLPENVRCCIEHSMSVNISARHAVS